MTMAAAGPTSAAERARGSPALLAVEGVAMLQGSELGIFNLEVCV